MSTLCYVISMIELHEFMLLFVQEPEILVIHGHIIQQFWQPFSYRCLQKDYWQGLDSAVLLTDIMVDWLAQLLVTYVPQSSNCRWQYHLACGPLGSAFTRSF